MKRIGYSLILLLPLLATSPARAQLAEKKVLTLEAAEKIAAARRDRGEKAQRDRCHRGR